MDVKILLVTGTRQVGKSTALRGAVTVLQDAGIEVSGLLTERTAVHDLAVTELRTGTRYPLTDPFVDLPGSPTRHFTMNVGALDRSRRALEEAFPAQVFVLDEIGPLELRYGQGWANVFGLLAGSVYAYAILVVRPELLGEALAQLNAGCCLLVRVTPDNRGELPALLAEEVMATLNEVAV